MLEQGYPQLAASMLLGATDAPVVEDLIRMGRAVVPANLERCRGWDDWLDYHSRYGRCCPSCGAYTYGSEEQAPETCGECGQPFDGHDRGALTGRAAAIARRINQVMEGDGWESDRDTATWQAPRQIVPDPIGGHGNLGLRMPGAECGELFGDSPYRSALSALDAYAYAAATNAQAVETLEAQLTVHGFDRDQALFRHVAALRESAALLQEHARNAQTGLFMRHTAGDEYHASGRDAAATAFRTGAARSARHAIRTEESTS
jgi:hypothetical protein